MGVASLIFQVGEAKTTKVTLIRPEANRSNYEQVKEISRTEPVNVAKFWDDL